MKGGIAAAMWATQDGARAGARARAATSSSTSSATRRWSGTARARSSSGRAAPTSRVSLEPTELQLCAAEGGLVHFRIEVEGVEAHASTRYLSVHAGGKRGGGVNAIEKTMKLVVALQELERQWANEKSHPILPPGYDTLSPGIIVGGPGRRLRRPAEPLLERRHGAELLLGRIQHVVVPGRGVRGRAGRGRGGRRGGLPHRPVAARASAALHLEARAASTSRRSTCRSTIRRWRRSPSAREVGLDPSPQGFGAATDLAWYGERRLPGIICGPGSLAQCHVADEYLETEQLLLAAKVYAQMLVEWCA